MLRLAVIGLLALVGMSVWLRPWLLDVWTQNSRAIGFTRQALVAIEQQPPQWPLAVRPGNCKPEVLSVDPQPPGSSRAVHLTAIRLLACGEVVAVEGLLQPLALGSPRDADLAMILSAVQLAQGREEETFEIWAKHPGVGLKALIRQVEREREAGNFDGVVRWLDRASVFLAQPPGIRSLPLHLRACIAYRDAGRYQDALAACQALTTQAPHVAGNWLLLARAHLQGRAFAEAEMALDKALAMEPQNGVYYYFLGQLYEGQGLILTAQAAFDMSAELAPTYGPTRLRLAELAQGRGHVAEAIIHLEAALQSDSSYIRQYAGRRLAELKVKRQ